jgi:hypothetical protein
VKCDTCGLGPEDGKSLYRQNEKGVIGVWRCFECCQKRPSAPVDPEVVELTEIIRGGS